MGEGWAWAGWLLSLSSPYRGGVDCEGSSERSACDVLGHHLSNSIQPLQSLDFKMQPAGPQHTVSATSSRWIPHVSNDASLGHSDVTIWRQLSTCPSGKNRQGHLCADATLAVQ